MGMNPRTLRPGSTFTPKSIPGLALWLDAADSSTLYTTDAGQVTAVSSPLDIAGCKLWLDADDAGTFTLVSGNVSEWRDKSGSGVPHATQSSAANRPTRTASGLNGRAVVEFQSAHALNFASSTASFNFLHNATGATVFFVLKPDATSNPDSLRYLFNNTNNSSSNTGVSIFIDDRSSVSRNNFLFASVNRGVGGQSTSSVQANNFYAALDAYSITSLTLDNGNAAAAQRLLARLNGVQDANVNSVTNAAATGNATFDLTIGNFGGLGAPAGIAEIIFYEGPLSAANRARVEMYLASKWGISVPHGSAATATNDPVGAWLDKSGNGRHATQATGASRPTISATAVNARRALGFNGTAGRLAIPSMDSTPSTVLAVARHNSGTSSSGRTPLCIMEGANYMSWQFQQTGTVRAGVTYNASQSHFTAGGIDPQGAVLLMTGQMSSAGGGMIGRLNGAGLPFTETVAYPDGGQSRIGCRFRNADDQFWSGEVCEVLHYQSALPLSQVQRLERYLASKWGITLAPQVSNADAQDWINRVYANGGTVSATTASAVNTFCDSITNAGIRDRFYRLNLFCGNSDASLAAVRTPLYRGPSIGGTQYGGTTDTNVNFVAGDYGEAAGLLSNGTTKYLNSTISPDTLGVPQTLHFSAYKGAGSWPTTQEIIGTRDADDFYQMQLRVDVANSVNGYIGPTSINGVINAPVTTGAALLTLSRASSTSLVLYSNGASVGVGSAASATLGACANNWFVFARNASGSAGFGTAVPLFGYSIGLGLDAPQQLAFYNASRAFHLALGRSA